MKSRILELILNRPNVRTVEIADRLDMDPESVRPMIADEIARGVIVEEPVTAPNGRTVTSFRYATAKPQAAVVTEAMADPFPARVLRALPPGERPIVERERPLSSRPAGPPPPRASDPLSLALAPRHIAAAPAPEQAQADEPLEIDVPVTRKESVPLVPATPAVFAAGRVKQPTRVEVALACLRAAEGKPVQTAELSKAMGLPFGHHPGSYLKVAIQKGRVVRNGTEWALGESERGNVPFAGWANPPAAVELPAPVVTPREVPLSPGERAVLAKLPAQEAEPTAPQFPRADPAALSVYVPGSKRCTMNCGPHADDPRSAAERAFLCDECEIVAPTTGEIDFVRGMADEAPFKKFLPADGEQAAQAPAALGALPAAKWEPTGEQRTVGMVGVAKVVRVQADHGLSLVNVPAGGLPNIKTPYIPQVASGAPDITRNGLYENGEFRKSVEEVLTSHIPGVEQAPSEKGLLWTKGGIMVAANDVRAGMRLNVPAAKFLAAILSDGSMELRLPGRGVVPLTAEEARELYQFMQRMGYAAWPKAA